MKYDTPKMELFVTVVCITVIAAWLCAVACIAARLNIPDGLATIIAIAAFYFGIKACLSLQDMLRAAQRAEKLEEKIERYFSGNKYDLY